MNAVFNLTSSHRILGVLSLSAPKRVEILGIAYVSPKGKMESKMRFRYPSGQKDVITILPKANEGEGAFVDSFGRGYSHLRDTFPELNGRFVRADKDEIMRLENLLAQAV